MQLRWLGVVVIGLAICDRGVAAAQPTDPVTEGPPQPAPSAEGRAQVAVDIGPVIDEVMQRVTSPQLQAIALGTVRRARRAIALGPTVGAWGAYIPSQEMGEHALTAGLGLELFRVPVLPDLATFKALIAERVKAKLREQIVARFMGAPPPPGELDRMASEIFEEVKAEMSGQLDVRAKTMERPRLTLALEADRLNRSELWVGRGRVGIGIWNVTAALTVGVAFADSTTVLTGGELATHFLLSKGARSPVVDVFVRYELAVTPDDELDFVTFGARFLLDVI
ncbi:MAG: hypothetical protein H0T89_16165 [Deltaproteobacteria bacterium]|nr:hypothetical protein [Deltaproteobacteria bacterium]MDQ3301240.1 hypothetical protein [Myxococcota bacterium]